ncbi:hypothetical protein EV385_2455 [Krasilnikovia cinnamomea]|uniref:Uncharacterized protein n=1 Tax=Krasilnikovia cinnamomea TaxID=349313 RepID=A0A4Q7ZIK6_9ACTN|nr:hypothetical protein [Krasilnikovia cinnamomea]RZU50677.1 hypothetical protein EV385_2455 [Krasilnikovia cinnamomea]
MNLEPLATVAADPAPFPTRPIGRRRFAAEVLANWLTTTVPDMNVSYDGDCTVTVAALTVRYLPGAVQIALPDRYTLEGEVVVYADDPFAIATIVDLYLASTQVTS